MRKDRYGAANKGIYAGNYMKKTQMYVGAGLQSEFMDTIPGRITVNGTAAPGLYLISMSSIEGEALNDNTSSYLLNNKSQVCTFFYKLYSRLNLNLNFSHTNG